MKIWRDVAMPTISATTSAAQTRTYVTYISKNVFTRSARVSRAYGQIFK